MLNKLTNQKPGKCYLNYLTNQKRPNSYIRRTAPNFHQSYPRISTDNMDVTDCVSSRGSMEYYEDRLRTFDTYPKQMLPDKFQLARAGLYYTGKSDICQCFRCHVKLSSWERDDDAIKEHFKWSSNCEYMNRVAATPPRQTSVASFGGFWGGI